MRSHATILTIAAAMALVIAGCQAISLEDLVKVKTPPQVQREVGLPSKLPLSVARGEYETWRAEVQRSDAQWRESIEGGAEFVGLLSGFAMTQLEAYSPLAGPAAAPLLLLGGYFFGNRRIRKEKESSYNAGIRIGKDLLGNGPVAREES